LDELADRASNSRDQALATLFADDIGAEIRYCAHELGRSKAYDIDGIVKELASKHRNQIVEGCDILVAQLKREGEASGKEEVRKKLDTLVWEGQSVPVRNPELVDVLLKVQEAETRLEGADGQERIGKGDTGKRTQKGSGSKKGVAAYDAILLALSDAEDVARKLVEAQQVFLAALCNPVFIYELCFS
jgi:signal recognition particle subunit SRP68